MDDQWAIIPTGSAIVYREDLQLMAEALDWLAWCKKQGTYTGPDRTAPAVCESVRALLVRIVKSAR